MATITPTGMIFVPSRGGISHSPQEFTAPLDMARGAHVLYGGQGRNQTGTACGHAVFRLD